MYCVICNRLKFTLICKTCLEGLWYLEPKRILDNGLFVFSAFALSEVRHLIYSKNNIIGSRILHLLGTYSVNRFLQSHSEINDINRKYTCVVCVRGDIVGLYSHSAILARCFRMHGFHVNYNALISHSNRRFSLLKHAERMLADRLFSFNLNNRFDSVIIVDDVITTSKTLLQASKAILDSNKIPLFAWTLCDARY